MKTIKLKNNEPYKKENNYISACGHRDWHWEYPAWKGKYPEQKPSEIQLLTRCVDCLYKNKELMDYFKSFGRIYSN